MKVKVRKWSDGHGESGTNCWWWCPGCEEAHIWQVDATSGPNWEWDGNIETPTVSPSILTAGSRPEKRCHVFIKNGIIDYLSDCWHALAGKKVPMVDLPEWLTNDA